QSLEEARQHPAVTGSSPLGPAWPDQRRGLQPPEHPIELVEVDVEDLRHLQDHLVALDPARLQDADRGEDLKRLGETALGAVVGRDEHLVVLRKTAGLEWHDAM